MFPDPLQPSRSLFVKEIQPLYRSLRQGILLQVRNEVCRDQKSLDVEKLDKSIQDMLNVIESKVINSAKISFNIIYQKSIDSFIRDIINQDKSFKLNASITKSDSESVNKIVDMFKVAIQENHSKLKARILRNSKNIEGITPINKQNYEDLNKIFISAIPFILIKYCNLVWSQAQLNRINEYGLFKRWNCIEDGQARESHKTIDGITIPPELPFNVPQYSPNYSDKRVREAPSVEMQYPGDPLNNPDTKQTEGCRCLISARIEGPKVVEYSEQIDKV